MTARPPDRRARAVLVGLLAVVVLGVVGLGMWAAATDGADDVARSPTTAPPATLPPTTLPPTTVRPPTETTVPPATLPPTTSPPPTETTVPSTTGPTTTPAPVGTPAVVIHRGDPADRRVALTFDAGSDVGHTGEILDTLRSNRVRATFGMTGRWAEEHPVLVARIADEGHLLINHSYDHPSFTGYSTGTAPLSTAARLDQLARAEAAIQAAAGVTSKPWFRPPYGDEDESVRADVGSAGYGYEVMWTVDSLGWQGLAVDEVIARCLGGASPGAIYLFHVGSDSTDHAALQAVIDGLRARGLGFATVAELVG
jgi:peptidoglycan-N-acetylglucosamine deacetylase